jgi:hypothetical protein
MYSTLIIDAVSVKLPKSVGNFLFSGFRIIGRPPVQICAQACFSSTFMHSTISSITFRSREATATHLLSMRRRGWGEGHSCFLHCDDDAFVHSVFFYQHV